jgi:N,N'-diacetyllegionaminate synthase
MKTLIIAEAGVNHNGSREMARELVVAAAKAGADIVKFQSFITSKNISFTAPKAEYQKVTTGTKDSQYEMVQSLELDRSDHAFLVQTCKQHNIGFLSTAFDNESFDLLVELGASKVKIPSGEITNLPLIRYITRLGLPVFLSTGMANLGEIEEAIEIIVKNGTPRSHITVLHCNTEYPTPMQDVNLRAMCSIRDAFGVAVGYSDHTTGIEVPIAAVALGAAVIEKHLTLDRNLAGPDHMASLEPNEFTAMVRAIRNIEQAMGDGVKRPSPSEAKNKPIARKSLVAARDIVAGEPFTPENITAKRPGTGLSPMRWDEVVGRTAARSFAADELITL